MLRALHAATAALVLSVVLAPPASAQSGGDLSAAQKKANQAAAKLAAAETELAKAEREINELRARTTATRNRVAGLEAQLREIGVTQYLTGGLTPELSAKSVNQAVRGEAMLSYVVGGSTDALDAYRAAREDLEAGTAALEEQLEQRQAAVARLRAQRAAVMAELRRLEEAQRQAEAKAAAERAAAAKRAREQAASRRSAGAPAAAARPAAAPARVIGGGDWVCPVQGPRAFSNDWGQPRSGGRSHQGNDILAPRGTPVVANVSGTVRPHQSSLGGISYYLSGDDGNTYFGTHLDSLTGVSGRVSAGTQIGTVGNTGNARGGPPHLHFEIHVGGRPVNPYPTLVRYC